MMKELDGAWRSTCRTVLGEDIGALEGYLPWLSEYTNPVFHAASCVSGKDVAFTMDEYCRSSRRISLDEMDFNRKFEPLSLNEIKDIDSIIEAISGIAVYTGSIVLGNSSNVEKSSNIMDSHYICNCTQLGNCKYIVHGTLGRQCEYCFGGNAIAESSTCIKCHETTRDSRSFELWFSQSTSDSYYSFNLKNCSNCIFCFNLQNRHYCVGNVEFDKSTYNSIKKRLIRQIVDELKQKKRVPALLDIINQSRIEKAPILSASRGASDDLQDKKTIEEAFLSTTGVIFGKPLKGGMDRYREWLLQHTHPTDLCKSVASGEPLWRSNYSNNTLLPKERLVSLEEAKSIGEILKLEPSEAEKIDIHNAHKSIGKLAYLVCEWFEGTKSNLIDCTCHIDAANCYRVGAAIYAKYSGYSFWPKGSEYAFGADTLFDSSSCINCYYSSKLSRCFEMDGCSNCSDSYFCHNVENCRDCMFCFNIKGLHYAIGNVEYAKDEYMTLKKRLLELIWRKLNSEKGLDIDIYTIGCGVKK